MESTRAPWAKATEQSAAPRREFPLPANVTSRNDATPPQVAVATPRMPQVIADGSTAFRSAAKSITSEADLRAFLQSQTTSDFLSFILFLNQSVQGIPVSDAPPPSANVAKMLSVLDTLSRWVDEIPPLTQSLRYGNPAYRIWTARLLAETEALVKPLLPELFQAASIEVVPYFLDSFGNSTRIDYGTGHETTFCAFLYCLCCLGAFDAKDAACLVLRVFNSYLKLMRKLQTTYWLEPAGSHGVWGLDDYQFLPFIWGASQLVGHPTIRPRSIHDKEAVEACEEDFLYLQCLQFIKHVKKGPLQETSPYINDISGVPKWQKVNSGLIKMYQVEVLGKVPIMQHFLFGSIMPPPP